MWCKNQDYDKTCIFSPKDVSEINYDWEAHQVSPIALYGAKETDKINFLTLYDGELKLLHYKFISKDNYVNRQKTSATRLSENDKKNWSRSSIFLYKTKNGDGF